MSDPAASLRPVGSAGGPPLLVVIAKACVPGRVKTRLTPPLTPVQAAALALASLEQTLRTVRTVRGVDRVLLLDGDPDGIDTTGFEVVPQVAGPLDERIAAVLDRAASRLLLIGMDTPQVPAALLQSVVDDDVHDAWFGPAADGGFWALGLRDPHGGLVRGVPMSRDDTGDRQRERLRDAGLRCRTLPVLVDMDRIEDAAAVAAAAAGTPFAAAFAALDPARQAG